MPYKVVFRADVLIEGDVQKVKKSKLRDVIEEIAANPLVGKPLTGDLQGYRSTRIGGDEGRVVYKINDARGEVEVVAMGQRKNDAVYDLAAKRV